MRERPSHPINRPVFFIPLAVLATALIASLWQGARFLAAETAFNDWILRNFGPMFTISSVLFLALLAAIALSPFGGTIIGGAGAKPLLGRRSDEHTSELQSLMRKSYAVFCLKKKKEQNKKQSLTNAHNIVLI